MLRGLFIGAVVAVIAGAGESKSAAKSVAPAAAPQLPLTPAKAGVQVPQVLDSRLRGNERA